MYCLQNTTPESACHPIPAHIIWCNCVIGQSNLHTGLICKTLPEFFIVFWVFLKWLKWYDLWFTSHKSCLKHRKAGAFASRTASDLITVAWRREAYWIIYTHLFFAAQAKRVRGVDVDHTYSEQISGFLCRRWHHSSSCWAETVCDTNTEEVSVQDPPAGESLITLINNMQLFSLEPQTFHLKTLSNWSFQYLKFFTS